MTQKTVNEILYKNDFSDSEVIKTALSIRQYNKRLNFSEAWITDFVYEIVMLAKKNPQQTESDK